MENYKFEYEAIFIFINIFLENPNLSAKQIADFYNKYYPNKTKEVTSDYVYKCLKCKESYTLLANNLYDFVVNKIEKQGQIKNKQKKLTL